MPERFTEALRAASEPTDRGFSQPDEIPYKPSDSPREESGFEPSVEPYIPKSIRYLIPLSTISARCSAAGLLRSSSAPLEDVDIALDSDRYDFAVRVEFEDRRPVARDVLMLEGNKREPEGPTERDPSARNFSR